MVKKNSSEDVSSEVAEVILDLGHEDNIPAKGSREWVFTINNWTEADEAGVKNMKCRYLIYGKEVGKQGTPHLQGYVVFTDQKTLSALKKIMPRAYLAMRSKWSTPEDCRKYIRGPYSKNGKEKAENPDVYETGDIPRQGERTDLVAFNRAIQEGKRGRDLSVDHLPVRAKYPKLEQTLVYEDDKERAHRQFDDGMVPEVHVRWGKAGVGKSRLAFDRHGTRNVFRPIITKGGTIWYDGYDEEDVIQLEEFYGQCEVSHFLNLTDRYPMQLPVKGKHAWRLATKIYITSNRPPETWYPEFQDQGMEQFMRRFTTVTEVQ